MDLETARKVVLAYLERQASDLNNRIWRLRWGNRAAVRRALNGPWPKREEGADVRR